MDILLLVLGVVLLYIFAINPTQAQDLHIKLTKSVYLNAVTTTDDVPKTIVFPNINKIPLYQNKSLKKDIQSLEAKRTRDYRQLDALLTEYVTNFGIKNFAQNEDLDFVWKLGQVKELLGDTLSAMFYYSLALKNHSRYYRNIKVHFDALRSNKQNDYVDIDYYNKIIEKLAKIDTIRPPSGVKTNMGPRINSNYPDYAPYMHPTNKVLIFTSRRILPGRANISGEENEDLYFSEYDANLPAKVPKPEPKNTKNPEITSDTTKVGGWGYAEPFPATINTIYNEGSACLSKDGNELYFVRCDAPGGVGSCDIYRAKLIDGKWDDVQNIGESVNSPFWDSHPCLSQDGERLFFASTRPEGFGRTDLYVSRRQSDGNWSPALNLGPIINTIEDEVSPFFHPINSTLYFSSTGHQKNNGGYDIFKSRLIGDGDIWEEPVNLGPLINTKRDEYYFSIDSDGDTLFYAGAAANNPRNMDLFSFPMPMTARPDAVYSLNGYLIDQASGNPLTGIITAIDLDKGTEIVPIYIAPNGFFEFKLIKNRNYKLVVMGENAFKIPENPSPDTVAAILNRSAEALKPIVFENLEFKLGSANLTPEIEKKVDLLITFLKANPNKKLVISGHTDSDGDADFNRSLSRVRAENIRKYIIAKAKVADTLVVAQGFGDRKPIFPNDTPENKARNRRVEFEFMPADKPIGKPDKLPSIDEGNP